MLASPDDLEELVFRFAEGAEHDGGRRRALVAGVRAAMRLALLERAWLGSDRVLGRMTAAARRWARWRAPRVARMMAVDAGDMKSLGAIQDWEDRVVGVVGRWAEASERCAVRHELACPFTDLAARDARFCTDLVHALETETFRALAPSYRLVPLSRLLSKGDSSCVFEHHLD